MAHYMAPKYDRDYSQIKVYRKKLNLGKYNPLLTKVKAYANENSVTVLMVPTFFCRVLMTLLIPIQVFFEGINSIDYVKDVLFCELFGKISAGETYFMDAPDFPEDAFDFGW